MKVREVIKLIEGDGWYLARTRGSHCQFKHATKTGLVTIAGKLSDRKKQGYKPPDLSVEKTRILSLFQAPGFRHGVNLKSKI
ncbi:MAG: addiction module toxin, HicA family [Symploca sp. SIO1C2]|nr:addiction module toxin, HicA family [Symploca sp. SIO1C2]